MLFIDILPYREVEEKIHHVIPKEVNDTVDTIVGLGQQVTDNVTTNGNGTTGFIISAIVAALAALGICLMFVINYRQAKQLKVNGAEL